MKFFFTALITFSLGLVVAQYQETLVLRKSAKKSITSTFGFATVKIEYGSPKQKERTLWGDLIPYGEVWRLGADAATTLTVSSDFMIADNKVKAGKYAMFLKPNENEPWDFILNYQSEQWGAYDYDDSLDVLKFKVAPIVVEYERENLTLDFEEYQEGKANLSIQWGDKLLLIPFSVDVLNQFLTTAQPKIDATNKTERWAANLQAAEYLANRKENLTLALDWIKEAHKEYKKHGTVWIEKANDYYYGHILWAEAKIYAAMGKHKKALKIAKEVALNKTEKSYYTYENDPDRENIDGLMAVWKD